jgi:mRNA interferase RelE/StbE
VKKVVGENVYRLRVGKYRVILDIIDEALVILVIRASHRKNIYKK